MQKQKTKFKQTEIGKIPEDWDVEPLEEFVLPEKGSIKIGPFGSQLKREFLVKEGYKLYGQENIFTNDFFVGDRYITKERFDLLSSCELKPGDLIISMMGTIGFVTIVPKDIQKGIMDSHLLRLRIDENKTIKKFIFYAFKSRKIQDQIDILSVGTIMAGLSSSIIKMLLFPMPPISEQRNIVKILSYLDAKIELNNKMNKALEAIGQALFKKWFVNERKKEWKEGKLGDYVESVSGCSYTSKGLNSSENALVTLKSVGVNGFKQDGFKEYTGKYNEKYLVQEGDIVVAHTDLTQDRIILGKPVIVRDFGKYKKMIASMDLSIVKPIKLINKPYLFYLLNSKSFHGHAQGYSNGTTVIHLSRKAIPEFSFIIPDKEILEKFKIIADNLFNQIRINDLQNQKLSQIRDAFLPKLMSGEIRLK